MKSIAIFILVMGLCLITGPAAALEPHAPIIIGEDSDFLLPIDQSGVVSGDGSMTNPYMISGWLIDVTGTGKTFGIYIKDTTKRFVIENCTIHGAAAYEYAAGIYLSDNTAPYSTVAGNHVYLNTVGLFIEAYSAEVFIQGNWFYFNEFGIKLSGFFSIPISFVEYCHLEDNHMIYNHIGMKTYFTRYNDFIDNHFDGNDIGVSMDLSAFNEFSYGSVSNNDHNGIWVENSDYNTFRHLQIESNGNGTGARGLVLNSTSDQNKVWNNNFVDNGDPGRTQAADYGNANQWSGDPDCHEGNYWSTLNSCWRWVYFLHPSTCIPYCYTHNYYLDGSAETYDDRPVKYPFDTQ